MPDRRSWTDRIGLSLCGRGNPAGPSVSPTPPGLSPHMQARVEAVLDAPVRVEAAQPPVVDPRALWDRMEAHGISQNKTARRGRDQLRHALPDNERPAHSVGEAPGEAAPGPVPADGGGTGGPRRGEGAGLEEGQSQRGGGARRRRRGLAARTPAAAPCASKGGFPGAPRWSTPTAPVTTAGAGSR